MISQEDLKELLAKTEAEQKEAASKALNVHYSKQERREAKRKFFDLYGFKRGLLTAFGKAE